MAQALQNHSLEAESSANELLVYPHAVPDAAPAISPSMDAGGLSNIMLLSHPLAIVYISSCRQDYQMVYVSPQIAQLGFTRETCLNKPDFRLQQVHQEDFMRFDRAFRHSCGTAETFSCKYRLYDSNGKVRWFHDEASVVCDEVDVPLFIRGVLFDITEKKEMETELNQHRYYLDRQVEQRTRQLTKRLSLLETCNANLCDKLASAQKELSALSHKLRSEIFSGKSDVCVS